MDLSGSFSSEYSGHWLAVEQTLRKRYHEAYRIYDSQRSRPSLARISSLSNEPTTTMGKVWGKLTDELLRRLNSIADVAKLKSFSFHTDDTAPGSTMRPNLTEYAIEESLEFTFATVYPNIALWNVSNGNDLDYQIQLSWPLDWASRDVDNVTAVSILIDPCKYVLDGNAPGMSATEAWRRRDAFDLVQPDYIVVSIGYPISDSVYGSQRSIDYQPMTLGEDPPAVPDVREGSDDFIYFLEHSLKPFVNSQISNVDIDRGAVWALLWWLVRPVRASHQTGSVRYIHVCKPHAVLGWWTARTETDEQWGFREELYATFAMNDDGNALYESLKGNEALRDVVLKEYVGSHHAAVAAAALANEIDHFMDW
ncbi:putative Alpha/Beta hydrolase protein [Seiridium cardinale]